MKGEIDKDTTAAQANPPMMDSNKLAGLVAFYYSTI
jgi:hypothetical protein